MHTPWDQQYNQSYPVYVTYINRGLGYTKTVKMEDCDVVIIDHCIYYNTFESKSSNIQAYNLDQQVFSD